jgi:hypothetical protein
MFSAMTPLTWTIIGCTVVLFFQLNGIRRALLAAALIAIQMAARGR